VQGQEPKQAEQRQSSSDPETHKKIYEPKKMKDK